MKDNENVPEDERTMNLQKQSASVFSSHWTNQEGKVPVLDLKLKVYTKETRYSMNSRIVILYKSAHSIKMEMAVLVKEGVRQIRNNSRGMDGEVLRKVMAQWSRKLIRSGYPETVRHKVSMTACEWWQKM